MNRFTKPGAVAGYKPLSYQELAFAPTQLRQREDRMHTASDEILTKMDNIVGYEGFDEETNAMKAGMKEKLEKLSANIQKNGSGNINYQNELRNLKNEYNSMVSKTGALGMSSAIKEGMSAQRAAYYKMGLANDQAPADIEREWAKQAAKYTQGLPTSTADLKGQIPTFEPAMPPKRQDLAQHAAKLHTIMGSVKTEFGSPVFKPKTDPATGVTTYEIYDKSGYKITNQPQVKAMMDLIRMDVMDPNSAIAQDMKYRGMSEEDYLNKVGLIEVGMAQQAEGEKLSYKGGGGGGATGSDITNADGSRKATLTEANNNSSEKVEYSQTVESIHGRVNELRRDTEIPEYEKEREMDSLRQAEKIKLKEESSEVFKTAMDEKIGANKDLEVLGITNWDQYKAIRDQTGDDIEYADKVGVEHNAFGSVKVINQVPKKELARQHIIDMKKDLAETNPVLAGSKQYTFGSGESDLKQQKLLAATLPIDQLKSLAATGQIELSNKRAGDLMYETIDPNTRQHQDFLDNLSSANLKFTFGAINSGSAMAGPEIVYSMQIGNGDDAKKYDFSIDLSKGGYGEELLAVGSSLYNSLDPEGRTVLATVRDNIQYAGLATHVVGLDDPGHIYNNEATANIVNHSTQRTSEQFKYNVKNKKNPNKLDEVIQDSLFIKDDGNQYAIRMNDDGSYSTYKHEPGSPRETPYTFGDYIEKETMAQYAQKNIKNEEEFTYEYLTGPEGKAWKEDMQIKAMETILDVTGDIENLSNTLVIYNESKRFKDAVQEWYMLEDKQLSVAERRRAKLDLVKKISGSTLQTKRKKMAL